MPKRIIFLSGLIIFYDPVGPYTIKLCIAIPGQDISIRQLSIYAFMD